MPNSYAVMDEEEMMYVEGGATYYSAAECVELAAEAQRWLNIYASNIGGTSGLGYVGYAELIEMYAYQSVQYTAGSKANGVYYYNAWKIEVVE